jgi:heat shock protein HslJ
MRLPHGQRSFVVVAAILACMVCACGAPTVLPTATPAVALPSATPAPASTPVVSTAAPAPTLKPQTTALVSAPGLTGVVWALQRFEYMSGKVTAIDQPDRYTVEFLTDGRVQVKADCNTGSGTYRTSGDRLTIESIALTKMACPAGSQSDKFVQSLGMAISYVLDGAELTISMSYDAGDMVFKKGK